MEDTIKRIYNPFADRGSCFFATNQLHDIHLASSTMSSTVEDFEENMASFLAFHINQTTLCHIKSNHFFPFSPFDIVRRSLDEWTYPKGDRNKCQPLVNLVPIRSAKPTR
jgi:hypothetical protein